MKKSLLFAGLAFSLIASGQTVKTVVGNGMSGFAGDGYIATDAELQYPNSLTFDKNNNLFFVDGNNNRIRKINTSGIITTIAGNGGSGFSGDGGQATAATISPNSIVLDSSGNIYFSEPSHHIRKINPSGIITTIAGTGVSGYNGDGIAATAAEIYYPYLGYVDYFGNIYFSDYGNHRVRKINASGIITTIAGNGTNGDSGDGLPATAAELKAPVFMSISPTGEIYIPDNVDRRIRKIDATGIITTFAGNGSLGSTGDSEPATNASFSLPNSVTFDNSGNVYIADATSNVIRKVNTDGIISTVAGTGTSGFNGDGLSATATEFNYLNFVYFNTDGNLYVADMENNRIRRITYNTTAVNGITKTLQNAIIYPNPAKDEITIKTTDKIQSIEVIDLIGQEVTSPQLSHGEIEVLLNISLLPSGIYFVKVNGVYAGKFIKD